MTKTLTTNAPFRADHVGSLLRPSRVKQARIQKQNGEITADQLRSIEDTEIIRLVEQQKEAGLQAVTDGELRRAWWHFDFLSGLDGVDFYETDSGLQFNDVETRPHGVKVTGKIDFSNHPMIEDYKSLHEIAGDHLAKFTIPSPNMLIVRSQDREKVYEREEDFIDDLITAYQKAVQAFYDAGCRYLQFDDTSWSSLFSEESREQLRQNGRDPEKLVKLFQRAINESIAYKPSDMTITMHICRGNFQSSFKSEGGYEFASEIIFGGLNVNGLFLEFDDERSGGFEPLRHVNRDDLQIVLGLVTSKSGDLEDPKKIKARINEANQYVPINQLCLSPQCGFASTEEGNLLTEEQQWNKVRHVISIANDVWQ